MACGQDSGCLKIAQTIYPNYQTQINNSMNAITKELTEVNTELETLISVENPIVPDDYLGQKVTQEITKICENITADIEAVQKANTNINTFIDQKIKDHQRHYNDWKKAQDEKKEEEENKDNT